MVSTMSARITRAPKVIATGEDRQQSQAEHADPDQPVGLAGPLVGAVGEDANQVQGGQDIHRLGGPEVQRERMNPPNATSSTMVRTLALATSGVGS